MIDEERYAELLAQARPALIESPEEHEKIRSALPNSWMEKGEQLTPEERRLLAVFVRVPDRCL